MARKPRGGEASWQLLPSRRSSARLGAQRARTEVSQAPVTTPSVALPSETWQAIAVHFSTQELARGLTGTCKRLRDLNLDAIYITSTKPPANVTARSGCMVSVNLRSDSLESPLCTNTICAIRTAKWTLRLTVKRALPQSLTRWGALQKLEMRLLALGSAYERVPINELANIPTVRVQSCSSMWLFMPRFARWQHLSLECRDKLDVLSEDAGIFGQGLETLRLGYNTFIGGDAGGDVKLSLNLMKQGMTEIAERVHAEGIKALEASRPPAGPSDRSALIARDACICGACAVCLVAAGVLHDFHQPAEGEGSPLLKGLPRFRYRYDLEEIDHEPPEDDGDG